MTDQDWQPNPAHEAALKALTQWTFSLLTMRADTPHGEWLADDYQEVYQQGWQDAIAALGDDDASEFALLDMLNMADTLLEWLSMFTQKSKAEWLQTLRESYVDDQPQDGGE